MSLPPDAAVVVIGGGVMGTSIVFHLAEAGVRDVLLLERGELGAGSTAKAAGGVRAQFSDEVNIRLGARSLSAFERFSDRPGREIDLHQVGYLFLYTDEGTLSDARAAVELQNSLGVPTRWLSADEAAALAPPVHCADVLGASFHRRDGFTSPDGVVQGYAAGARRLGATVLTGIEVTGIVLEGGEIRAVDTPVGRVRTGVVVCAAGAWSARLGESAGVDLPVSPLRRQILVTEPLPERLASLYPASLPMTIDAASTFYLHREGPGVLLGMSYAAEQPGFHETYSEEWLPELTAVLERRCPSLLDVGVAHRWAGLYEDTPDHNALIGEAGSVSRFLYATGFSGHGFLQAPAVGEVIRDLLCGREPVVDVGPLSADRFSSGRLRVEQRVV